ncbi:putative disease resistance RPP13-like protein 1 [Arachis duranensis]|uniref:Disease resistance RPP13-like protein 1 n=1 Tax=Arachis duranensis TaxID=130453 RepID=A0A6P4CFY8_ARADU|nr:putative disease resistance RPP13-like protein 1 [Arachis duranensis]
MAQGFISSSDQDGDDMEKQAWRCIKELLDRYIFEESKIDDNGNFKFRLEGRMGDFVKFYVGGEYQSRFLDYYYDKEPTQKGLITRHYTLNVGVQASLPESIPRAEKLHTLMILSDQYSFPDPINTANLLRRTKRLRALHLSSCSIKELPQNIAHLLHLRYLDLSFNHDLKKLPKAICSLLHLQTLNLNGCDSLQKLPKDIGKLVNLLYLEILWTTSLSYLPKGIATLTMLRRLNRFFGNSSANNSKACNLGDLENLNKIRGHITIDGLGAEADVSGAKKASLKNKKDLLGLELWFSFVGSQRKDEAVLEALEAPPRLQGLGIFYYQGESFPNWMTALQNLTHVMLADCSNCSDLPPLGKLLALQSLTIKNMSEVNMVGSGFLGIQLNNAGAGAESSGSSSSEAFPKLQELCFEKLNNWENWIGIGDDGDCAKVIMPSLSSLSIINCSKLRTIPNYIKLKTNLSGGIKRCPSLDLSQHQLSSIFQGTTTTDKVRSS